MMQDDFAVHCCMHWFHTEKYLVMQCTQQCREGVRWCKMTLQSKLKSSAAQHADAAKLKDVYRMHWFQTEKYFAWYSKAVMHSCQSQKKTRKRVQHCSTYSAKGDSLHFTFNAFHSSLPRQTWTCLPYNINPTPSQFDSKSRIFPSLPASFYLSY